MIEFDNLGKQYVEKRRRSSPVKNLKNTKISYNVIFNQKIEKRPSHTFADTAAGIFAAGSKPKRKINFSFAFLKKTIALAAFILLCFLGLNWNIFAGIFSPYALPEPPLDPISPLMVLASANMPTTNMSTTNIPDSYYFNDELLEAALTGIKPIKTIDYSVHEVKNMENAYKIAERYSLRVDSIITANNLKDASRLTVGQLLKIPNMDGIPYTIKEGDSISSIASKNRVKVNDILDVNNIEDDKKLMAGQTIFLPGARMNSDELVKAIGLIPVKPMIAPVPGKVTSRWGWREDPFNPGSGRMIFHYAIDYSGNIGDPVKAAMQGTVLLVNRNPLLGNYIVISHSGGLQSLYAHLSRTTVRERETVRQGQTIGRVGDTGRVTGAHLHFEVRRNGTRINPNEVIR